MTSHKKFGPDRFSHFDVYWIQTDRQTPRQAKIIYRYIHILALEGASRPSSKLVVNMFTINSEDGREAPSKARKKGAKRLEFLVIIIIIIF